MKKSDVDIIVHKNKESRSHIITPLLFMRRYILADKWLIRRAVNIVTESHDISVVLGRDRRKLRMLNKQFGAFG